MRRVRLQTRKSLWYRSTLDLAILQARAVSGARRRADISRMVPSSSPVRTEPSQGLNTGSNPVGTTTFTPFLRISGARSLILHSRVAALRGREKHGTVTA